MNQNDTALIKKMLSAALPALGNIGGLFGFVKTPVISLTENEFFRLRAIMEGKKGRPKRRSVTRQKLDNNKEKILELRNEGLSIIKLAKRENVSPDTLKSWLSEQS